MTTNQQWHNMNIVPSQLTSAKTHFKMGNVLHEQGKLEDAIESYIQALQLNPKFVEAYNNLGNVLKDLGRLEYAAHGVDSGRPLKEERKQSRQERNPRIRNRG